MPKRPKRIGNLNGEIGTAGPTIGDENAAGSPAGVEPAAAVASGPDEYVIAAQSACAILYALGMTIGGDEWKPSDDEHTNLATAFEGYFRAKGLSDIPPGWALTIAVGVYVGPRMRKPKTLSTLQKIGAGVRGLFAWFKRGRIAAAIPEVARRDQPQPVSDNGRR